MRSGIPNGEYRPSVRRTSVGASAKGVRITHRVLVVFERDVSGCAHSATVGPPGGEITVAQDTFENDRITVFTENSVGTSAIRSVHLVAVC